MGKFYSGTVTYKWSWDQVAQAFWQRYPNPYSNHVLTEDILSRHVQGHCLYTRRLLTKTNPVPRWGERFIPNSARKMCVIEESVVDAESRTITTYTRNMAMQHVMNVEEKCVYQISPDNSKWTVCEKSAWVSSAVFGFGAAITAFGIDRFKKNAAKASRGYEHVLERMFTPALHHQAVSAAAASNTDKFKDKAIKVAQAAKAKAPTSIMSPRPQPS
ncbi:PRELI domain-containing protein 1, mitochondrial-like [Babylonia areolata]|uniref:PRELI domain-containing protein 1, mitochondrial-like n=1 Tax=Babylonia areolata TaxID=304850 RepID=UPI003FD122D7